MVHSVACALQAANSDTAHLKELVVWLKQSQLLLEKANYASFQELMPVAQC